MVDVEFIKVTKANCKERVKWNDSGAQILLVRESTPRESDILVLGRYTIPVPLASVHLEWEGTEGTLNLGMLDCIPMEMLVGTLLTVTQAVNVVTHSKKEYSVIAEVNGEITESTVVGGENTSTSVSAEESSVHSGVARVSSNFCVAEESSMLSELTGGVNSCY